ncbi:RUS1 family protein C16orf58 homolog [Agrilus planipennis]|uniref:RUS1 family protein C16orf58 homolog n=1 Tax=Agrilus planipennis TaxID=224129 RepID=A0A7F5RJW6_AGRPL|nr:RUS1 family protein C16orf58 homolog [Agrilus planipennis]
MTQKQLLIVEKCGSLGRSVLFSREEGINTVVSSTSAETFSTSLLQRVQDLFREVFLPHGYPDSVSEDYLEFQIWDTVQAFCSTITGTFTTQAILKGVGVGDAEATPFAAAVTWIVKDGTGMLGRIIFAWWKGTGLDADCKKWRLVADILNDAAMCLELFVPMISSYSLQILCMTTTMKAVVGVAGGATRASLTQHQAIKGNMADVSAKDGSQETFVNLVASFCGIFLLAILTEPRQEWALFIIFTVIHLLANYKAVCAVKFAHLNISRLVIVLDTYIRHNTVPNPQTVNKKEPVVIGFGPKVEQICGYKIKIATSFQSIASSIKSSELRYYIEAFSSQKYLLIPCPKRRIIYIALQNDETSEDVISAYFHAVLLGIATCYYNDVPLNLHLKRQLHHVTPVMRLYIVLKEYTRSVGEYEKNLPFDVLKALNDFVIQEKQMFFTALKINRWNTDLHALEVGEWRANWRIDSSESYGHCHHSKKDN